MAAIEDLKIQVTAAGTDQAAAALKKVDNAIKGTADQAKTGGQSFQQFTQAGKGLASSLTNIAGAASTIGAALGSSLNPKVAQAIQGISGMITQTIGLTAAMGPAGTAIGLLSGGLPFLVSALNNSADAMTRVKLETGGAVESLNRFIAANRRARDEASLLERIRTGTTSAEEAAGLSAQNTAAGNAARQRIRRGAAGGRSRLEQRTDFGLVSGTRNEATEGQVIALAEGAAMRGASQSEITRLIREAAPGYDLTAVNDIAIAASELSGSLRAAPVFEQQRQDAENRDLVGSTVADITSDAIAASRGQSRGGGGGRARGPGGIGFAKEEAIREYAEGQRNQEQYEAHQIDVVSAAREHAAEVAQRAYAAIAQAQQAAMEQEQEFRATATAAADDFAGAWRGSVDDVIASFDRLNDARDDLDQGALASSRLLETSARSAANTVGDTFGEAIPAAFGASFGAIINGQQSADEALAAFVDSALTSVATTSAVHALEETALGFASLFSPEKGGPAGATAHFTAAGIFAATAALAGGGAAAIDTGGGGGGGGAGRAGGSFASGNDRDRGGGGETIVVNINAPTDAAQLGQQIDVATRAARRRHGAFGGRG